MNHLSIRFRLTLWYCLMFASAGLLLSVTSWWMLQRSLDAAEYHELQERSDDVRGLLERLGPQKSSESPQSSFNQLYEFKDSGKWLQVMDEDGHWVYRSRRMIAQNPILLLPQKLPKAGEISHFKQGNQDVLTLAYPIELHGRMYSVQTGLSLNKSMVVLKSFRVELFFMTPAVILLAAAGGHFMSRKALAPVAALAVEARRINDRNLHTRLPVPEPRDEISHLTETLNQMLARIDASFQSVKAFTGNASHELRTPITLLRTEIEVTLYQPRSAPEYRQTLERLLAETVKMTVLIENLMSIARADAGVESVHTEPVDVTDILRQTERSWKVAMHSALLEFRVECLDEELLMLADPVAIRRLIAILLENACRYTFPGGMVTLTVIARERDVVFSVCDTGIGIAPEHLPRIFERFYRVSQADTPVPQGSGLGLSLAKWIAEKHGSEIHVKSKPGCGSCFTFSVARYSSQRANLAGNLEFSLRAKPRQ